MKQSIMAIMRTAKTSWLRQLLRRTTFLKACFFLTDESSGTTQGEGLVLKASNTKDNRSYFSIFTFYRKLIIHRGERLLSAPERSPNQSMHPRNFGCDVNRDLKHRRRNGTTTPTGNEIFPREPSGHA